MTRWRHLVILILLSGLLFFLNLGKIGLTDVDEGRNAEAGREMVETGNWIAPTFNYEPRFQKPVFIYWLMSGAYRLFGLNEFAARFHSALFGCALILLQYLFLARTRSPAVGLLGGLMLLLNVEMVAIGRMALTDMVLVFFVTLSLFSFWLGLHGGGRSRHYSWLLYVGIGLGTLTKGPIGFGLPLLVIAAYLTFTKRWQEFWKRGFPLAGSLLFLSLVIPWYVVMFQIHGPRFLEFLQSDNIGRFLGVKEGHGGTVFFYFPVLLIGFFPWCLTLTKALAQAFRKWRETEMDLFAALWVLAIFLFFSASATRLPHYIAPLFPPAAILVASDWNRRMSDLQRRVLRTSLFCLAALLIVLHGILPPLGKYFLAPPQELASIAGHHLGPNDRFLVYGLYRPSLVFYARRKAMFLRPGEEEKIRLSLSQPGRTTVLLPTHLKEGLLAKEVAPPIVEERSGYLLLSN